MRLRAGVSAAMGGGMRRIRGLTSHQVRIRGWWPTHAANGARYETGPSACATCALTAAVGRDKRLPQVGRQPRFPEPVPFFKLIGSLGACGRTRFYSRNVRGLSGGRPSLERRSLL